MYTLAFDTTSDFCSVGLFKDGEKQEVFEKEMDFGQAEVLMPKIAEILQNRDLRFKDLGLAVVCTGPGSFTGVRSSVSAARAFSLACPEVTVCGVSAFEAYAADFEPDELAEINAVLIETKREDFYVQYYDCNLGKKGTPHTAFYEDIIHFLSSHKVSLAGEGL